MAEEIDLGTLNFNTDKLAKSLLDARVQIDQLKTSLSENRKAMRESEKVAVGLEVAQAKLAKQGKQDTDEYKKATNAINALRNQQEKLTESILTEEQSVRKLSKEQKTLTSILDAQAKSTDSNTAAIDRAVTASNEEVKTIAQARASNTELLKLRNDLYIAGGNNADKLAELNGALDKNNAFIKENVSAYEQQKIGIGDYQTAIEGALGGVRVFGISLNDAKGAAQKFSGMFTLLKKDVAQTATEFGEAKAATEGYSGAQKMAFFTTQGLSAGLKLLRIALIATGIGAIVVVLGSLIAYLSTTQAGIDAVTSVTRPLSAVFQTLLGVFQNIGGDIFKNPLGALKDMGNFVKHQLIEYFGSLGKIIKGVFTLDGDLIKEGRDQMQKLTDENTKALNGFAKGVGAKMKEAIEKGKEIDRLQKKQEQLETSIASRRAAATDEMKKQENIFLDQTNSFEKRNAAADKAKEIARDLVAQENEILDVEIERLKLKQSLNDTSREEEKQLDELIAKKIDNNAKIYDIDKKTLRLKKQMNDDEKSSQKAIADAAKAAAQERLDAALKLQQVELDKFVLLNTGRQQNAAEEIQFAKDTSAKRLSILDEEYKQGKKTKAEYELEKLKIGQDALKEEADIVLFYAGLKVNSEILELERLRSERKRITTESSADEIGAINALNKLKAEQLQVQLDARIISQREFNQSMAQLEVEKNEQITEIDTAWELQRREDEKLSRLLDNEQKLLELTGFMEQERIIEQQAYDEKQDALSAQRDQGLISEENYLKSIEILNQKHAQALAKIDQARFQSKLKIASDTAGSLATIAGEETEAGKFFASAQAAIDAYRGAQAAYVGMIEAIPGPAGIVLGAIAAAAATVQGFKTIAKIQGVDTNFYTGGYTGDGGTFEKRGNVHAGEVVFSQADVQKLGGAASVESMRPTSDLYNEMPRGVAQDQTDNNALMAAIIGEAVERGSMRGTSQGVVDAGDNRHVKEKAMF